MTAPQAPASRNPIDSDVVRFGGGFIVVCLVLISIVGFGMAIGDVSHYFDIKTWPSTTGTVVRAAIDDVRGEDSAAQGRFRFKPLLSFTYEIDGEARKDTSERLFEPMDKSSAAKVVAAHPPGSALPIYYDPDKPKKITLDNDPPLMKAGTMGFLIPSVVMWIYFGGWLIPAMLRNRRARRQSTP